MTITITESDALWLVITVLFCLCVLIQMQVWAIRSDRRLDGAWFKSVRQDMNKMESRVTELEKSLEQD